MSGFNQVILLGRLGNDPEVKYLQSGTAVVSLSLATSRKRKDQAGESIEETSWHRVKGFGRQAEIIAEHCRKGDLLFVEGRLDYWEAEGKRGKLMVADIILEHFEFGGSPRRAAAPEPAPSRADRRSAAMEEARSALGAHHAESKPAAPASDYVDPFIDDDIPF